ncbi:MAG: HK97 gp10 family phage protein [Ruminococcaceae bacterium]|nr:HK97 gp10 family phage protein [Oscillospiraceae bacterium]
MGLPKSVVKIKKDGVEFTSNVDRVNYTIVELTRAALRDVGRLVCNRARQRIKKNTGRLAKNTQYWVRKKECDLQVGFKPGGWYGIFQELGTEKQPKIGALFNAVSENIDTIRDIEGKYLSAIEDEQQALSLINEGEYEGDE